MSNVLKKVIQAIHPIEEEVLEEYLTLWDDFACPRKTLITDEGQTENYIYFVKEGIQKSYYLNDGKQHVMAFTYPASFSGIPESFITQTASKYFLESITPSKFIRISYSNHKAALEKHRSIETFTRKLVEGILVGVSERQYELLALDMRSRFRIFMKRSAHLINIIPHKDLASYLRINSTNFSKLLNSEKI